MNFCAKVAGTLVRNALLKEKTADNVVVSPLGFNIVLNMVAKNMTGRAAEQLSDCLQLNSKAAAGGAESDPLPSNLEKMLKMNAGDGFSLRCVNKALHDKAFPLQPSFHRLVTQDYKAAVEEVDFQFGDRRAIVDSVNSWVKKQTDGLVPNIICNDDVNSLTRLLLVNALNFKGKWSDPFDPEWTKDREFQLLDGKTVMVPFMSGCQRYYHTKIDYFDVIKIPYRNNDVSMYIFLPAEELKFQDVLYLIDGENFLHLDFKKAEPSYGRKLLIPKFNIEYKTDKLPDVLLGNVESSIRMASFLPDDNDEDLFIRTTSLSADDNIVHQKYDRDSFSRMTSLLADLDNVVHQPYDEGLFVGKMLQNSAIKVDEAGTEAASATCLTLCGAPQRPPPPIVVDRPFLFLIREEKSKLALFFGAVTNPRT